MRIVPGWFLLSLFVILAPRVARTQEKAPGCARGEQAEMLRGALAESAAPLSEPDRRLLDRVVQRITAATRSEALAWPPRVHAVRMPLNALALCVEERGRAVPYVIVSDQILEKIARGREGALAMVIGHEFGHLALGHVLGARREDAPLFARLAYGREREFDADAFAAVAAVRAGYSLAEAIEGARAFYDELGSEGPIAASASTHPSWSERLARLDRENATLWRASAAFESGVYLLAAERYRDAERAFERVAREFPNAHEAHANLGYARLMHYLDGISADDVRQRSIGQLALGSFYRDPGVGRWRGRLDPETWRRAVADLERAVKLDPRAPVPLSNLAVAHLVAPRGVRKAEVLRYAEQAWTEAKARPDLSMLPVLVNVAAALDAVGEGRKARAAFAAAEELAAPEAALGSVEAAAILYHRAMALARDPRRARESLSLLEGYLEIASAATPWWTVAYGEYAALARRTAAPLRPREDFAGDGAERRPVVSVDFGDGGRVALGDRWDEAVERLGLAIAVPIPGDGAPVRRAHHPARGVSLLGTDTVIGISLAGSAAPAVAVPQRGIGGDRGVLRLGMHAEEVLALLGRPAGMATLFEAGRIHYVWPRANVAVAVAAARVVEILVVAMPSR